MSEIRAIVTGTFKDYAAFSEFVKRLCTFVEENEPGTLRYEFFVDEAGGRFISYEAYADGAAFLAHGQKIQEQGFMEEVAQLVEFDGGSVLGEIADPQVKEAAQQFGLVDLHELASVAR